jgi:hypothetical protein
MRLQIDYRAITKRLHSFQSRNTAIAQHFKAITVRLQSDYRANVKSLHSASKSDTIAIAQRFNAKSERLHGL